MPLAHGGLVKLAEECGELTQIAAKKIAYPDIDLHPDGESMKARLEAECADVLAAVAVVIEKHNLNSMWIDMRFNKKRELFRQWSNEK